MSNPILDHALLTAARFYPYRDDFSPKQIRVIWRALGIYKDLRRWAQENQENQKTQTNELGMDGSGKVNPRKVREEAVD
jgi:hypothetical protein